MPLTLGTRSLLSVAVTPARLINLMIIDLACVGFVPRWLWGTSPRLCEFRRHISGCQQANLASSTRWA